MFGFQQNSQRKHKWHRDVFFLKVWTQRCFCFSANFPIGFKEQQEKMKNHLQWKHI